MSEDSLKDQRDRFLGFAFAASDMLMEIGKDSKVLSAFGAVKGMTGFEDKVLLGRLWKNLFISPDQAVLDSLARNAKDGRRAGPVLVTMQDESQNATRPVLVSLIRMPGSPSVYITLSHANTLTRRLGQETRQQAEANGLMGQKDFAKSAQETLMAAKEAGQEVDLTLLDMSGLESMKRRVSGDQWEQMMGVMTSLLKTRSLDGQSATQISENQYGILHDKSLTAENLVEQLSGVLKEHDPEGMGVEIQSMSVDADLGPLSEREAARALMYTLHEFERKGVDLSLDNLGDGFKGFLDENAHKIQKFKAIIANLDFQLHFQPIVSLPNLAVSHYEILTRFRDGGSPYEWIVFGEDVGLAADFDLAVCERAFRYMSHDASTTNKFAINISGQSIQNDEFFASLQKKLKEHKKFAERIVFEITESAQIENLDKVNGFIKMLQADGFKVCLDDFGAGSASFQYLHKLHVNTVKLDGAYTMNILKNKRDEAMVKNLAQLCKDLDVKIVAERVETAEEARMLYHMGVDYGQGYWFSKPLPKPDYKIDSGKAAQIY